MKLSLTKTKKQEIHTVTRSMPPNALKTLASPQHKTSRREIGNFASTSAATKALDLVRRTKRQPDGAAGESGPSVPRLERLNGDSLPHPIVGRKESESSCFFSSTQRLQPHGSSLIHPHSRASRLRIIDDGQKRNTTIPKPRKDNSDAKQQSRWVPHDKRRVSPTVSSRAAFYSKVITRQVSQAAEQAAKRAQIERTRPKSSEKLVLSSELPDSAASTIFATMFASLLRFLIVGWHMCVRLVTTASAQHIHVAVTSRESDDFRISQDSKSARKAHAVKF